MARIQDPFNELAELIDDLPAAMRVIVKVRGLEQKTVAAQVGIAESVLSRAMTRNGKPSLQTARRMAVWIAR